MTFIIISVNIKRFKKNIKLNKEFILSLYDQDIKYKKILYILSI